MVKRIPHSDFVVICNSQGLGITSVLPCIVGSFKNGDLAIETSHPAAPKVYSGLGDYVADGLAAVGITKERVSKVLGRDCGCKKRQQLLNKIGQKVVDYVRGNNGDKLDDRTH